MKNLRIRLLTLSKRSCLSLWTNKTRQSIDLHRNNLSMDVGVRDQRFDDYRFSSSYRENYKYGPFYRSRSKTQTLDVDLLMMSSGLAYGTTSSSGDFIQVEAYRGAIPPGDQGIEFFTNTEPHVKNLPEGFRVHWFFEVDAFVGKIYMEGKDYAVLSIVVTKHIP